MRIPNFETDALSISKIGHGKYLYEKAMLYGIPKLTLYYNFVHIKYLHTYNVIHCVKEKINQKRQMVDINANQE